MKVAIIKFDQNNKGYWFNSGTLFLNVNDYVVVETIKGLEVGKVTDLLEVENPTTTEPIKPVLRIADTTDINTHFENIRLATEVVQKTKELSKKHDLNIKVINASYTLNKSKLLIHFEADTRIDFRELLKDLNDLYKSRIELRQIGVRDAAKIIGSIGACGYIICCTNYLENFENITIKMAKNQNISINSQKVSGLCGKLFCCIKYEDEEYTKLKSELPKLKQIGLYENEKVEIIEIQYISKKIKVRKLSDNSIVVIKHDEFKII